MNTMLERIRMTQVGFMVFMFFSMVAHSTELPSGSERRPDLSVDPFESTREAINKLPSPATGKDEKEQVAPLGSDKFLELKVLSPLEPKDTLRLDSAEGKAITQGLSLTMDYFSLVSGGDPSKDINSGSALLSQYFMQINSSGLGLWRNGVLYSQLSFYVPGTNSPSGIVGDFNGMSNIDNGNESVVKLFQLWYKQGFSYSKSDILFGLHSIDTEFYRTKYSRLFVNNSFRMGTGLRSVAKPSAYPNTSLGVRYKSKLLADSYIQAGIYDGSPTLGSDPRDLRINKREGSFNIVETGIVQSAQDKTEYLKLALGAWYLYQNITEFAGLSENFDAVGNRGQFNEPGIGGLYFIGEGAVGDSLGLFVVAGQTESRIARVNRFAALGLNFSGLIPGRPIDVLGIGVAHSRQSAAFIQANEAVDFDNNGVADDCCFVAETTLELTYKVKVTKWLVIQPDFQFIHQPAMSYFLGNTYVVGLRLQSVF